MPCSVFTVPLPTLIGEQTTRLDVRADRARRRRPRYRRWNRPRPLRGNGPSRWAPGGPAASASPSLLEDRRWRCAWRGPDRFACSIILTMCERWRWVLVSCTATWYLVAPMPQRFTFSKDTAAPDVERGDGVGDGGLVGAGIGQRADQHVAANSRKCVQIASNRHELSL